MENQKAEKVPLINVRALYKFMVTFLIPGGVDRYDLISCNMLCCMKLRKSAQGLVALQRSICHNYYIKVTVY